MLGMHFAVQFTVSGADIQPGGQATQHTRISDEEETGGGATSLGPTSVESKSRLQASSRLQVCFYVCRNWPAVFLYSCVGRQFEKNIPHVDSMICCEGARPFGTFCLQQLKPS